MSFALKRLTRLVLPSVLRRRLRAWLHDNVITIAIVRWQAGTGRSIVSGLATARSWKQVRLGSDCTVDSGAHFHTNDEADQIRIEIEQGCFIGRNAFFSAGELIHVKSHCNIGAACKLLAAGHAFNDPTISYISSHVLSYGCMELGPNTWVGVGSTLIGGLKIGFGTVIGAGSLVRQSLPPLCMAAGVPAHIVKLYDWPTQTWVNLATEQLERAAAIERHLATIPTEERYISLLRTRIELA